MLFAQIIAIGECRRPSPVNCSPQENTLKLESPGFSRQYDTLLKSFWADCELSCEETVRPGSPIIVYTRKPARRSNPAFFNSNSFLLDHLYLLIFNGLEWHLKL